LNRWKSHFPQLLNVQSVTLDRNTYSWAISIWSSPEVEIAIAKLKRFKSPGSDQILAELIQAGGETLWCQTQKFVNPI
jgi:hypothetical protein